MPFPSHLKYTYIKFLISQTIMIIQTNKHPLEENP